MYFLLYWSFEMRHFVIPVHRGDNVEIHHGESLVLDITAGTFLYLAEGLGEIGLSLVRLGVSCSFRCFLTWPRPILAHRAQQMSAT